jgi:hypothetical protein
VTINGAQDPFHIGPRQRPGRLTATPDGTLNRADQIIPQSIGAVQKAKELAQTA